MYYFDLDFEEVLIVVAVLGAAIVGTILFKKWRKGGVFPSFTNVASSDLKTAVCLYVEQVIIAFQKGASMPKVIDVISGTQATLAEKFLLLSGFFEVDAQGNTLVRTGMNIPQVDRFLQDLRENRYDKLLAAAADTPSTVFYAR